jgi:hypothetical protein
MARLDAIEAEIAAARLPKWFGEQAYLLRAAIELVRERLVSPDAKSTPGFPDRLREGEDLGAPARLTHQPGRQYGAPPGEAPGGDLKT